MPHQFLLRAVAEQDAGFDDIMVGFVPRIRLAPYLYRRLPRSPRADLFQVRRNRVPVSLAFDFDDEKVRGVAGAAVDADVGALVGVSWLDEVEIQVKPGKPAAELVPVVGCQVGLAFLGLGGGTGPVSVDAPTLRPRRRGEFGPAVPSLCPVLHDFDFLWRQTVEGVNRLVYLTL